MSDKPEDLTQEEREQLRRIMSKIGKSRGNRRIAQLSPEERSAMGKKGALSRWGNRPRCPCGKMTLARATARGHKCSIP